MFLYIALIIQITILVVSYRKYSKEKNYFALFVLLGDLATIGVTYFSGYENFLWTKEIYFFAPVKYSANGYNEGDYYGGWEDEYPQGYGRITYNHFVDEQYYSINDSDGTHKAIYYEGNFEHGRRMGEGVVVYEDGYKDVGTFYGKWEADKLVFEGTRWKDDKYYAKLKIIAKDTVSGEDIYETDHWMIKE